MTTDFQHTVQSYYQYLLKFKMGSLKGSNLLKFLFLTDTKNAQWSFTTLSWSPLKGDIIIYLLSENVLEKLSDQLMILVRKICQFTPNLEYHNTKQTYLLYTGHKQTSNCAIVMKCGATKEANISVC